MSNLDPCQPWSFRLRAPPSIVDGMIQLGSVLWTFEATTAPIPHIQAIAGTMKKSWLIKYQRSILLKKLPRLLGLFNEKVIVASFCV